MPSAKTWLPLLLLSCIAVVAGSIGACSDDKSIDGAPNDGGVGGAIPGDSAVPPGANPVVDGGTPSDDGGTIVGACDYDAAARPFTEPDAATDADAGGAPADTFVSISPKATSVALYHPLTIAIATSDAFKNGFDSDEVSVDVDVTGPCGETIVQPCFFKSAANGQAEWECRFAPRHLGEHTYSVALKEAGGLARSKIYGLSVTATTSDGFLHADAAHAASPNASSEYNFRFDSGKLWRGVGENVAWEIGAYKFPVAIPRLHADGLNMMRIWHSFFSLAIEWGGAPNHYNADSANYFDQIVELAEENGVYLMVMMNDYREFHEHWSENPYNKANGGWCNAGGEFFSNADAKAAYKKKLRYYIARWGYSPAIQSFEFWNEIDNAMNEDSSIHPNDLVSWASEMASYIHSNDPYGHLVTASVSYVNLDFWATTGIDFTQSHLYGQNNKISNLPSHIQSYTNTFKKPYTCGEFSRRWEAANTEPSANYRQELHYGMWLGMVQATPILPMTWWWDSHWGWGDDFVFKSVAAFSNDLVEKAGKGAVLTLSTSSASSNGGLESGGLATGKYGYVWVSNYNPGKGTASNVALTVSGLRKGNNTYTVEAFDTWNGGFGAATNVTSQDGTLVLKVGTLNTSSTQSDAAYRIVDVNAP